MVRGDVAIRRANRTSGSGASGSSEISDSAYRAELRSVIGRLQRGTLSERDVNAFIATAQRYYASKRPAALPGFITAFRTLTTLRNSLAQDGWMSAFNSKVRANFGHVGMLLTPSEMRIFRAAADSAVSAHHLVTDHLDESGKTDWSKLRVVLAPSELHNPQAVRKERQKKAEKANALKSARFYLDRADAAAAFFRRSKGWTSIGYMYHSAFLFALGRDEYRVRDKLSRELKKSNPDVQRLQRYTAALRHGMGAFPTVEGPSGRRAMNATELASWLKEAQKLDDERMDKAADIAAVFGAPGVAVAAGLHVVRIGRRYARGDVDGFGAALEAGSATLDLAMARFMKGPGKLFAKSLKVGGAEFARQFVPQAYAIWTRKGLTYPQRVSAIQDAFAGALFKATVRTVAAQLGTLTEAVSDEHKREIVDALVDLARDMGVKWNADEYLKRFFEIPEGKRKAS